MLAARSDLPLNRDDSGRFIPWIIALMVYLACLALAGALVARGIAAHWSQGLAGTLTVQILPGEEDAAARAAHLEAALALLRATPGVASAEALSERRIEELVAPWVSAGEAKELPLPALIDLRLAPGAELDLKDLSRRLAAAAPGAVIDDHQQWLQAAGGLADSVIWGAGIVMLLVAAAAAIAVIFGTRTSLAIHRSIIELVHLIGAQDDYVARQFQAHALRVGLLGGITGLLAAVATLLGLGYGLTATSGVLPQIEIAPWPWAGLLLLPLASALIAMLTARVTVLRTLARMV
jgi:cell division transport system permease protein